MLCGTSTLVTTSPATRSFHRAFREYVHLQAPVVLSRANSHSKNCSPEKSGYKFFINPCTRRVRGGSATVS